MGMAFSALAPGRMAGWGASGVESGAQGSGGGRTRLRARAVSLQSWALRVTCSADAPCASSATASWSGPTSLSRCRRTACSTCARAAADRLSFSAAGLPNDSQTSDQPDMASMPLCAGFIRMKCTQEFESRVSLILLSQRISAGAMP